MTDWNYDGTNVTVSLGGSGWIPQHWLGYPFGEGLAQAALTLPALAAEWARQCTPLAAYLVRSQHPDGYWGLNTTVDTPDLRRGPRVVTFLQWYYTHVQDAAVAGAINKYAQFLISDPLWYGVATDSKDIVQDVGPGLVTGFVSLAVADLLAWPSTFVATKTGERDGASGEAAQGDGQSAPAPPVPAAPGFTLFEMGMGNYSCFRVPGVVHTGTSILVFAEAMTSGKGCNDHGPKDIVARRSTDGGVTWGALIPVLGDTLATGTSIMYRNPTPVYHRYHGRAGGVVLLNVVNCTDLNGPGAWLSLQLRSTDDGLSWSEPERVVGMGAYDGTLAGPGFGIQLGRHSETNKRDPILSNRVLYCGATGYHKGHAMSAIVWYSDDGGQSYSVSPDAVFKVRFRVRFSTSCGT